MSSKVSPLVFSMMISLGACGDDTSSGDGGGAGSGPANPNTLSAITNDIFIPSCGVDACHGAGMAGQLDLVVNPYVALVGAQSPAAAGETRVIAGDAANSYLIKKLENTPGIVGGIMPAAGNPLDAATIARIKGWIDGGAANN